METIRFKATLFEIGSWTILRLPESASAKLPSRGQAMVEGRINGVPLQTPLEPDGMWSHWFRLDDRLLKSLKVKAGDTVTVAIGPIKKWPEPEVPASLQRALAAAPQAQALWERITP